MPKRRLVIEFDDEDSDIAFAKRLGDLRARYPSWSVRTVSQSPHCPAPPDAQPRPPPTTTVDDFLAALPASPPRPLDTETASTCSSAGNVPGQPPQTVVVGMALRLRDPPHAGRLGTVAQIRNTDCFRVELGDASWWCTRDAAECVAEHAVDDHARIAAYEDALLHVRDHVRLGRELLDARLARAFALLDDATLPPV